MEYTERENTFYADFNYIWLTCWSECSEENKAKCLASEEQT